MPYRAIVFVFMLFGRSIYGQSTEERAYLPFDLSKPAYFPGGILEEKRYFKQQVPYPEKPGKITGNRLIVAFVIEKDGSVEKAHTYLFETPGKAFTEAVLNSIINKKWTPAEANGHPVRALMTLAFFFHHQAKLVSWRDFYVYVDSYEQLLQIPPEDLGKLAFPSPPQFMGLLPKDSAAFQLQYPEAATVQGEVVVDLLIGKDGTVRDMSLLHDIGSGCGEEALRMARLYRYWAPAQIFDSVYDAHAYLTFNCCNIPCNTRFHRYASCRMVKIEGGMPVPQPKVLFTREKPADAPHFSPTDDEQVYEVSAVDQPAFYVVPGEKGIRELLIRRWPDRKKVLMQKGILLKVLIEKSGRVGEARVIAGIDPVLDKKALGIVQNMEEWTPAYKNGHPVRCRQTVLIR